MKLTGELKDKVTKAESMEAKKDIIAQAGMELSDDELDMVAGGTDFPNNIRREDLPLYNPKMLL